MVANSNLEVGAFYRHRKAGTIMEVRDVVAERYYDGAHYFYECYLPEEYRMKLLPITRADEWEEGVLDCEGNFYPLIIKEA